MNPSSIDVRDPEEIRYWCRKLHCTAHQLQDAIEQVGPMPSNVEAYLRQRADGLHNVELPPGRRPS